MVSMVASGVAAGGVGVALVPPEGMWNDMLAMGVDPLDKILRTILVYLGIVVLLRVAGKRLMAQMNSLDLVVVLLLSNVVQNAIIGADNSITGGILGAIVLVGVNALMDRWADRNDTVRRLLEGSPTTVVSDGVVDDAALRQLGMTRTELREALHRQGADSASEVHVAEIEPGGAIHVDLKPGEQAVSRAEFHAAIDQLSTLIKASRATP